MAIERHNLGIDRSWRSSANFWGSSAIEASSPENIFDSK
jgi:hypothetical protein